MTTNINHGVDRTGTPEAFATGLVTAPVIQPRLWFCLQSPIECACKGEAWQSRWAINQRACSFRACFEQDHVVMGVFT